MSESTKKVVCQVTFEIGQMEQLLATYAELLDRTQQRPPDRVEIAAISSVLHSFYNGLENIFLSIAKGLDQHLPAGPHWHRDLLLRMTQETADRASVISAEVARALVDYLAFRHFYRHSYSFFLEWSELKNLVVPLREVWAQVKKELHGFLQTLRPNGANR